MYPIDSKHSPLAGVGRKTANVVLGQAFNIPGITVDTHVKRLSQRLGFTKHSDAVKAEEDLMKIWPMNIWNTFSCMTLIYHAGNNVRLVNLNAKPAF